jgi:hypothetical protein
MKQMAEVSMLYDFRQVATAQSVPLFLGKFSKNTPLLQDLPIQIQQLYHVIDFVLRAKTKNRTAKVADFQEGGRFHKELVDEIIKSNQAGYSRITENTAETKLDYGYMILSVFGGFEKPKQEMEEILRAIDPRTAGAAANAVGAPQRTAYVPGAVRKRTPPNRNVLPKLVVQAPPQRERSPLRSSSPSPGASPAGSSNNEQLREAIQAAIMRGAVKQASANIRARRPALFDDDYEPPPPPPFGGGATSVVSVGNESSLTRLLNRVGTYESMSELWTVDTNSLRSLFPEALRMREPDVVVAEMEFQGGAFEPDVLIEDK